MEHFAARLGSDRNRCCATEREKARELQLARRPFFALGLSLHYGNLGISSQTTLEERIEFSDAATRRMWRALKDGASGDAERQLWRPTVWTHVFFWHLPKSLEFHGALAPFWQYGFENRHKREKRGFSRTFNAGVLQSVSLYVVV